MKIKKQITNTPLAVPQPVVNKKIQEVATNQLFAVNQLPQAEKLQFQLDPATQPPIPQYSLSDGNAPSFSSNDRVEFNNLSNITSNSPEIIALSDFIPCYTEQGELNKAGEFLQVKQDALLISCVDSLKNILNLIEQQEQGGSTSDLKKYINDSSNELYKFCNDFSSNVEWFLGSVEDVKKSFDFKKFKIENEKLLLKNSVTQQYLDNCPKNLNEILFTENNDLSNYSLTKLWLQLCSEYKESLIFGTGANNSLFVENGGSQQVINNDSYTVNKPINFNNKISFNQTQTQLPNLFAIDYNLVEQENFKRINQIFTSIFKNRKHSILNVPMKNLIGTDRQEKAKRLAQLSYLICKELHYSTSIRALKLREPVIFNNYGYALNQIDGTDNVKLFDFIVGNVGNDITEFANVKNISENNLKNSPSNRTLVGVAQKSFFDPNKIEILSFENRYINDDVTSINQKNRSAILTPGTAYYIEKILNFSESIKNKSIDTTSLQSFQFEIELITTSLFSGLIDSKDGIAFKTYTTPRSLNDVIVNSLPFNTGSSPTDISEDIVQSKDIRQLCLNPVYLLRYIEKELLLDKSNLLNRQNISDHITKNTTSDLSRVLISLAISQLFEDKSAELLFLLFMYVAAWVHVELGTNAAQTQLDAVIDSIKNYLNTLKLDTTTERLSNNEPAYNDLIFGNFSTKKVELAGVDSNSSEYVFESLTKIAKLISNFIKNTDSSAGENISTSRPNPFLIATSFDQQQLVATKTFFSGLSKESIIVLLFFLCCLVLHETNPEAITEILYDGYNGSAKKPTLKLKIEKVKTLEKIENIKTLEKVENADFVYDREVYVYEYDNIIAESEKMIFDEILKINKMTSWFVSYLTFLKNKLNSFSASLQGNKSKITFFDDIYLPVLNNLNNQAQLTGAALSLEQLRLLKSKLNYMKARLSNDYNSALKILVPYFVNFKLDPIVDKILPIEDVHLIAWKFLLSDYLKLPEFCEGLGNNKKIISIGITHKLYQKLQKSIAASNLTSASDKYNLINVNIYMIDNLRPLLVHKPKKFTFILNKFPNRVLNYFVDPALGEVLSSPGQELNMENFKYINYIPFSSYLDNQDSTSFIIEQINLKFLGFNDQQIEEIRSNHTKSFFMEEYLRFLSGCPFDEQAFFNYESKIDVFKPNNIVAPAKTLGAINYLKNTILIGNENVKKMLLSPKKFDRVFHITIDPDDFEVDIIETDKKIKAIGINTTATELVARYSNVIEKKTIINVDNSSTDVYKRITSQKNEIEFNEFYANIETVT